MNLSSSFSSSSPKSADDRLRFWERIRAARSVWSAAHSAAFESAGMPRTPNASRLRAPFQRSSLKQWMLSSLGLLLLSAFPLLAQPPTSAPDTNAIAQAMERVATAAAALSDLSSTNDAMLPEDLIPGDAPDQPDEMASTNAPASGTNMSADASNQYTPRSGRQSRSRRYSRQRPGQSNRSGNGYGIDSTNSSGFD